MNRNWYAVALVCLLCAALMAASRYMEHSVSELEHDLHNAYACAESGDYTGARIAFYATDTQAENFSRVWVLLVRRSLVDQLRQTLATLPAYTTPENLSDLAVETARAHTQLRQIRQSFFSCF